MALSERARTFLPVAALLAASLAVKWPALGGWFDSPDDWIGLDVAGSIARVDFFVWGDVITGDLGRRTGRPLPWLLWGWAWALFGASAWGYYLSNLLLQTAAGALLWVVLERHVGPTTALLGPALVLFNPLAGQAARFLSARDDELALVFALATVAAWPKARESKRAAVAVGVLFFAALASKPTAIVLAAMLPVLDVAELGRAEALRPSRAARAWLPLGVALLLASPMLWLVMTSAYGPLSGPGGAGAGNPVATPLLHGLLLPFGARGAPTWAWVADGARLAVVAVGIGVAIHGRRTSRPAVLFGLAWLALSLPLPWSSMARSQDLLFSDGRYLLMPMVGLAIALAGAVGPAEGRRSAIAVVAVVAVLSVALYGGVARSMLSHRGPGASLQAALQRASVESVPEGRLVVRADHLDRASRALLTSHGWSTFVPEANGRRPVVVLGGQVLRPVPAGPHGPASLQPTDPALAEELVLGRDGLVVGRGGRFDAVAPDNHPAVPRGR